MWAALFNAGASALGGGQSGGSSEPMYSVNPKSEASSGPNIFGGGATMFGGINTGTQGVDLTTIAAIAAVAVVALLVLRKK